MQGVDLPAMAQVVAMMTWVRHWTKCRALACQWDR